MSFENINMKVELHSSEKETLKYSEIPWMCGIFILSVMDNPTS